MTRQQKQLYLSNEPKPGDGMSNMKNVDVYLAEEKLRLLRQEIEAGYGQAERYEFSDRSVDEIVQTVLRTVGYRLSEEGSQIGTGFLSYDPRNER